MELTKIACGFAMQGHWLGNRKVGSQVKIDDRSRLPARGIVRRKRMSRERASHGTKERVHIFGVGYGLERTAGRMNA